MAQAGEFKSIIDPVYLTNLHENVEGKSIQTGQNASSLW